MKSVHLKARIAFAKRHIGKDCLFLSRVLWTDKTKIELFGYNNVSHVYRETGKAFLPKNTVPYTVKHGDASLMLWGCFAASGIGGFGKIDGGIMNKEKYDGTIGPITSNSLLGISV